MWEAEVGCSWFICIPSFSSIWVNGQIFNCHYLSLGEEKCYVSCEAWATPDYNSAHTLDVRRMLKLTAVLKSLSNTLFLNSLKRVGVKWTVWGIWSTFYEHISKNIFQAPYLNDHRSVASVSWRKVKIFFNFGCKHHTVITVFHILPAIISEDSSTPSPANTLKIRMAQLL